ncbi:MAG: nicotinate (nicotinamide) nucleotide adenylyltransferase, partial [Chloroflexi bacterium]|nr:nicotinate (nicotinamide) nucleotide adenylyltransferase [Chloroflexota bacterium]
AHVSPLKQAQTAAPAHHRLVMTRLAAATNPYFAVSTVDLDRAGPSYTVDTLALLQDELGPTTELYFIVGTDSLVNLAAWHEPARIIRHYRLVAVSRPAYPFDPAALDQVVPGAAQRVTYVPIPLLGLASSDLRQRVQRGQSIRYYVPPAVADYIMRHRLYNSEGMGGIEQ